MEKLFCGFAILAVFSSFSECRVLKDNRFGDKLDLDNPRGGVGGRVAGKMKAKIIRTDKEGYMRASCEFLPANEWSMTTGTIEFKQKAGSPLEMYMSLSGLSSNVPQYKVQVYTSGEIMQGCQNAGEPYVTGRYNGHLADLTPYNDNGEVELALLDVSATLLGKQSIFGRAIQITPADGKDPAACCIVVHEAMKDIMGDMKTATISQPIEISAPNLDLDEEGWSSLVDEIYREAEKNGIDPKTITNVERLSETGPQGGMEIPVGNDDLIGQGESSVMDAVYREAERQGIDPNSITNVIDLGESTDNTGTDGVQLGVQDNIDSSVMDAVSQEAKRQGIDPNSITKVIDLGESTDNIGTDEENLGVQGNIDSSIMNGVYEEAKRRGIDPNSITKVVDLGESADNTGTNGVQPGVQDNIDSSIMDAVYKESEKKGIDPKTISKVVELTDSNGDMGIPDGLSGEQQGETGDASLMDAVYKEAERRGIDPSTISQVIDVNSESSNGFNMPDTLDGVDDANMPSMLDAMYKAAKENNIPLETITKVIDMSEDPSDLDVDAFRKAGMTLVGKGKLDLEDIELLKAGQGFGSEDGSMPNSLDEILEEAKKNNISEDSVVKIIDLGASDMDEMTESGIDSGLPLDGNNELGAVANGEFDSRPVVLNESDIINQVVQQANDDGIPTDSITNIVEQGTTVEEGENQNSLED